MPYGNALITSDAVVAKLLLLLGIIGEAAAVSATRVRFSGSDIAARVQSIAIRESMNYSATVSAHFLVAAADGDDGGLSAVLSRTVLKILSRTLSTKCSLTFILL